MPAPDGRPFQSREDVAGAQTVAAVTLEVGGNQANPFDELGGVHGHPGGLERLLLASAEVVTLHGHLRLPGGLLCPNFTRATQRYQQKHYER